MKQGLLRINLVSGREAHILCNPCAGRDLGKVPYPCEAGENLAKISSISPAGRKEFLNEHSEYRNSREGVKKVNIAQNYPLLSLRDILSTGEVGEDSSFRTKAKNLCILFSSLMREEKGEVLTRRGRR